MLRDHYQYFSVSIIFHVVLLAVLIFSFNFSMPPPVLENTDKDEIISAVVLSDIPPMPNNQNNIVVQETAKQPVRQSNIQEVAATQTDPVIQTLSRPKKSMTKQELLKKMRHAMHVQDLLADIKKTHRQQKKLQHKRLTAQFQQTLRQQSEQSLRQQLLNENIKLTSTQARHARGEINKYKALILQVISEHWVIPTQVNKKLYCELMIRVAPGGMVLAAQVIKTSGDVLLDDSAQAAVLKASPLPVPTDQVAFAAFRQFVLKVRPEKM